MPPLAHDRKEKDQARGIDLVVHQNGRIVKYYYTAWRNALARAGLRDRDIRLYDLRHRLAGEYFASGADPAADQHQLGRLVLSTTTGRYVHVLAGAKKKAANLIPDITADNDLPSLLDRQK